MSNIHSSNPAEGEPITEPLTNDETGENMDNDEIRNNRSMEEVTEEKVKKEIAGRGGNEGSQGEAGGGSRGGLGTARSPCDLDIILSRGATKLGGLKALKAFFSKLERLGVGTRRAENIASDITWQNVLKGECEQVKMLGKRGQEREDRTVRTVLRAMRERVDLNVVMVTRWLDKVMKDWVMKDKKMIGGGRHRRLKLRARRICEEEYGRKWREEHQWKVRNLEKKFSKVVPEEDEGIIEGVAWKDEELGPEGKEDFKENVVVLGVIDPPLEDCEYRAPSTGRTL